MIMKFICKSSLMRELKIKLVFPAEYFPQLGKIIYQGLFYLFEGNYEDYLKFAEKFKQWNKTEQTFATKCKGYQEAKKGSKEVKEFSGVKEVWVC